MWSQTPTFQHVKQQKRCNGVYNKVQALKRKKKCLCRYHSDFCIAVCRPTQREWCRWTTQRCPSQAWTWHQSEQSDMATGRKTLGSVHDILHMNPINDHCTYSHISPWLGIQLDCTQRSSQKWDRWQFDLLPSLPPAEENPTRRNFHDQVH